MAGKNTAVFGIFRTEQDLDFAISKLRLAGFRNTDISILMPQNLGTKDMGAEKHTKAPEGATAGATTGAVLGGALGWLAGVGALAIPGLGPLIAAGPIMAVLAGAGVGAAVGGISGGLIGMGIPEYEAKRYEGLVKEGKILISIHCDDREWVRKARDILENCGAQDVASAGESEATIKGSKTDKPRPLDTMPAATSGPSTPHGRRSDQPRAFDTTPL